MPKIIVSYRRSDSSATAGRIYDHLVNHFGQGSVFMDVDAIPFGTDFRTHIRSELLQSDILLAVIGPNWVGTGPTGVRRIDDEADPVRVEVETALRHGITIVPVLMDGTPMPGTTQLPEALKALAFLNAAPVDMGRDFRAHMDRLSRSLDDILARSARLQVALPATAPVEPARAPGPRGAVLAGVAAAVLAAVLGTAGWLGWSRSSAGPSAPQAVLSQAQAPAEPSPSVPVLGGPKISDAAPITTGPSAPGKAAPSAPSPVAAPEPVRETTAPEMPVSVTPAAPTPGVRSKAHGTFAWYELWTVDTTAAQRFYRTVVGWEPRTSGVGDGAYTVLSAGSVPVAGLATIPAATVAQGARPAWVGYVTVTDVDGSTAEVKALGGTVYRAPADVPGIGRYALVADPQGAMIVLFKGLVDAVSQPTPPTAVGYTGWRELQAVDRDAAFAFYAKVFGWTKVEAVDVTSPGSQLFASAGADAAGAIKAKPASVPVPFWTYAFQVDGIAAAIERVKANGGTIAGPPSQGRGGAWTVSGLDPQGAVFALVSPKR